MPKVGYDLKDLEDTMGEIKRDTAKKNFIALRNELNKFIPESKCVDVIYTKNTDKMFFGMCVIPTFDEQDLSEIILGDKPVQIKRYVIEIDSKLLEIGLSSRELTAVVLHEVGHIIISQTTIKQTREAMDTYLEKNKEELSIKDTASYREILNYAIQDTMIKIGSMFNQNNEEVLADKFVAACGYGFELESSLKKITVSCKDMRRGAKVPKLMVMDYCLQLYKEVKIRRIGALHQFNKSRNNTGSCLQKRQIDNVIKALNRIDTNVMEESAIFLESLKKKNSLFGQLKYSGLKSIEDDLYEFRIRNKNADTEDDAMYILRQINVRLSLLSEYLSSEDLSDAEKDRWMKVYEMYIDLREDLSKKKIYNKKNYGLFFDYNQIDNM